jgi:hypothetical protein
LAAEPEAITWTGTEGETLFIELPDKSVGPGGVKTVFIVMTSDAV